MLEIAVHLTMSSSLMKKNVVV